MNHLSAFDWSEDDVSEDPMVNAKAAEGTIGAALAYAAAGMAVFPCSAGPQHRKRAKAPLTAHGVKDACTDSEQIRRWWTKWPTAMIGGAMGGDLRLLAIDLDRPKRPGDPDGLVAWAELTAEHGDAPRTHSQHTANGGRHHVFTMPEGLALGNSTGALPKGIDVRGHGGYVVLAPSRLADGSSYRMVDDTASGRFAAAPGWLLGLITGDRPGKGGMHELGPLPAHLAAEAPDGIVQAEVDLPKPTPKGVAGVCPTFHRMVQDAPTAGELVWWKTCELAVHTTGGAELAHRLAAQHPGYKHAETQAKVDRHVKGRFGPPTCATLESLYGADSPCRACPNRGWPTSSPVVFARLIKRKVTAQDGIPHQRAVIRIEGGEIASTADAAADALLAAGVAIYQRSGKLVTPVQDVVPASHGRTTIVARLSEIKAPGLVDRLSRVVDFQRWNARDKAHVRIDPPRNVAEVMLSREGAWPFPPVAGCVTAPTLRADGSLLQAPGYDHASRLYHLPAPGLVMPTMSANPTRADAEAALGRLNALLDGFCFAGPLDRAVALSGLMTPVLRGGMSAAPLHLIRAHTAGTGKSFLVDLAATIATGRPCPVSSVGAAPEELEKRLTALLLAGAPLVSLDNVNGEVGGDVLCQAVERPLVSLRPLGVSETREVECRAAVFCTGNNATVRGDMVRRTVTCNLDAGVERPELRRFGFNPLLRVQADRGRYVADVLTIALYGRGTAARTVCPPLGSFEDWSAAVRVPLVLLGMGDPAASMDAARAEDPELVAIRELFGHLETAPGLTIGSFYRTGQIEAASLNPGGRLDVSDSDFRAFLVRQFGTAGNVSPIRLGKFLQRIHGRVVDGYRLEMRSDKHHGHLFALVRQGGT